MKHISFILHGKLRNRARLIAACTHAFKRDYRLDMYVTEQKGHAADLAEKAVLEGTAYVICAGGDGSLNEVINGVMRATGWQEGSKRPEVRVGVYPSGTGNDFARTMRVLPDLAALKKGIDEDRCCPLDLGLAAFTGLDGAPCERYFINITDVGMGGVIARKTAGYARWMGSTLTFQLAILSTLLSYRKQPVRVAGGDFAYSGEIMNLVVANGKYFGGGLGIAPDARPDDGLFSLVVIGGISLLDYLKLQGKVRKCRLLAHPEVIYGQSAELSIDAPGHPLPIDMDGEFVGFSPLKIKLLPGAISFITV